MGPAAFSASVSNRYVPCYHVTKRVQECLEWDPHGSLGAQIFIILN
jgi:hypothetical protein